MKYLILSTFLCAVAAPALLADEPEYQEVETLLKTGRKTKSLPKGLVIRLEADLWKSAAKERADVDFGKKLQEIWEFSNDHVHRVVIEKPRKQAGQRVYVRVQSTPFDAKDLCADLLDGKVLNIATREGMGDGRRFVGTELDYGDRSIEILIDGQSALEMGECCAFAGYAETNAIAFGDLYEHLASQARAAFASQEPAEQ